MPGPKRTTISGRKALLILAVALFAVAGVIYFFVVKLKLGGTDAIRMQPAPATGAAPSQ